MNEAKRIALPQELKERNPIIPIKDLLVDYAAIVLSIFAYAYFQNVYVLILSIIISGIFIYRLQIIAHDGLHFAINENKKINDFITRYILLAIQFTPMSLNRKNHLNHHGKFSSMEDKDWQYYKASDKDTRSKFYTWVLMVFGFGFVFKIAFKLFGIVKTDIKEKEMPASTPEGLAEDVFAILVSQLIIFSIFYFTLGWMYYFIIWGFAVFGVMVPLNTIRSFAEHSIMEPDNSPSNRLFTFDGPFLELFIVSPHNMNFHYEHHEYMYIPYYNLPKLKILMLQNEYNYSTHTRNSYFNHIKNFFKALPILNTPKR